MKDKLHILEARKKALFAKQEKDDALMDLHKKVVEAIMDPKIKNFVIKEAHKKIDKWESGELCSVHYIKAWREILKKEGLSLKKVYCEMTLKVLRSDRTRLLAFS